ncbi:MFS transporter [Rhodococcoides kroppenstedtii]|uniref:MFS transporter n=1 Tax=Rhodococcoides kroppenstedtii TaxID=293050 RepID=UPI0028E7C690|nr:MFS transporter [Rhodococcus kroppenstedtii]
MKLTPRRERSLAIGACLSLVIGLSVGNLGNNLMPVILGGFSHRFDLSPTTAGLVATSQLLATAIVSLGIAGRAATSSRVRMARFGLIAAALGFAGAYLSGSVAILLLTNVVAGAGIGAVYAAASAALSATEDAQRSTTTTIFFSTVLLAALIVLIPLADGAGTGTVGFAVMAALCVVGVWPVRWLPELHERHRGQARPRVAYTFVAAVVLFSVTEQGAWSYAQLIGEQQTSMTSEEVAGALGLASTLSLVGVPLGGLILKWLGSRIALAVALSVDAAIKLVVATTPSSALFSLGTTMWQVSYLALLVILLGVAASSDRSGRWVAVTVGATTLGTALGPIAVGPIFEYIGGLGLGLFLLVATLLALCAIQCTLPRKPIEVDSTPVPVNSP